MSAQFVFSGLDELRAALRSLPADLADEASSIVLDAGNQIADNVRAIYDQHEVTGHLANSVTVDPQSAGRFGAGVIVKATDPIAWLFDNGSQARHYITAAGKEHKTGQMWGPSPPTHAFSGNMARGRRDMWGHLSDLLVSHGLVVTGDIT